MGMFCWRVLPEVNRYKLELKLDKCVKTGKIPSSHAFEVIKPGQIIGLLKLNSIHSIVNSCFRYDIIKSDFEIKLQTSKPYFYHIVNQNILGLIANARSPML